MIKEIKAKTILRKSKRPDSWFASSYSINLYRGCSHNCIYCDGRDSKYRVEGKFGEDMAVKINAPEILVRELDPTRKRKPFSGGYRTISGGVSDAYQSLEKKYELTRKTLELMLRFRHPVHILTKSTLVLRDIDLISEINRKYSAIISFSFSTVDDSITKITEPGVPSAGKRLDAVRQLKNEGITVGAYLMPLVPYLTDSPDQIDESVKALKEAGADFIICDGMTLKEGPQKDYFLESIDKNFPGLGDKIRNIYSDKNPYGMPDIRKVRPIYSYFDRSATKFGMPKRMPSELFVDLFDRADTVRVILEQLDYLTKIKGISGPYGYAANSLYRSEKKCTEMSDAELLSLPGIGKFTLKIIREIIETGTCSYYKKML